MLKKPRIQWVDIAKGLTILLVVFGHALQGVVDSQSITLSSSSSSLYIAKQIIYSFHMPLFFFLSGLFSGFIYRNARTVIQSRMHRIVVPYFIWSLILATTMQAASRFTTNGLGLHQFLLSPIVPFSEYWFLYLLFFIEMFYLIVYRFFPKAVLEVVFGVAVMLFILQPVLPTIWILPQMGKFLIYFALATMTSKFLMEDEIRNKLGKPLTIIAICVLFLISCSVLIHFLKSNNQDVVNYFLLVTSLLGGILIIGLSMWLEQTLYSAARSKLIVIGQNTMQIYVMHLIPLAALRILLLHILGKGQLWFVVILTFLFAMFLCWVGKFMISKLHLSKLLFGQS